MIDLEAEKQRAVAALAAGRTHVARYSHPCGWIVRTHRAPILKNSELTTSLYSQGAWRRELGLTLYAGQHLPGLLFGGNSVEIQHEKSGLRISFCALEALRAHRRERVGDHHGRRGEISLRSLTFEATPP